MAFLVALDRRTQPLEGVLTMPNRFAIITLALVSFSSSGIEQMPLSSFLRIARTQVPELVSTIQPILEYGSQTLEAPAQVDEFLSHVQAGRFQQAQEARFPTLPVPRLGAFRSGLGWFEQQPEPTLVPMNEDLHSILSPEFVCNVDREAWQPKPLDPNFPSIKRGHYLNPAYSDCDLARSIEMARVLNQLVQYPGSVSYQGSPLSSIADLTEALASDRYSLSVASVRVYADFIALSLDPAQQDPKYVVWPVYLGTGITLSRGRDLAVPAGHSEWVLTMTNEDGAFARVAFYHGTSGIGFFPKITERPEWTGERSLLSFDVETAEGYARTRDVLTAIQDYLSYFSYERASLAPTLPADGYGYLSVCNDSAAVIELMIGEREHSSTWPSGRALELPRLASRPQTNDRQVIEALGRLRNDFDQIAFEGLEQRILEMTPYAIQRRNFNWDPRLWRELTALRSR
jgi:hypothetical protein